MLTNRLLNIEPPHPTGPSDPFEPPRPEKKPLQTAAIIGAALLFLVIDIATGRMLALILVALAAPFAAYYWLRDRNKPAPDPGVALVHTPRVVPGDEMACTRCKTTVAYSTMSLNEHGYYCPPCAAALRAS